MKRMLCRLGLHMLEWTRLRLLPSGQVAADGYVCRNCGKVTLTVLTAA